MQFNVEKSVKRPYEAIVIVHPDASESDQKALFKKNKSIVEQFGGEWEAIDTWGKRTLANTIEDHRRGYYFYCAFETDPKAITELERTMKINDKVLRYMHRRLDERQPISKHVENYRKVLTESLNREKEREARDKTRRSRKRD